MTDLAIIPALPTLPPALVQVLFTINLLIPSISLFSMQTFTRNWKASCKAEGSLISRSRRLLLLFRHCSVRSCTRSPNRARIWNWKRLSSPHPTYLRNSKALLTQLFFIILELTSPNSFPLFQSSPDPTLFFITLKLTWPNLFPSFQSSAHPTLFIIPKLASPNLPLLHHHLPWDFLISWDWHLTFAQPFWS